jgi:hypothetical protein
VKPPPHLSPASRARWRAWCRLWSFNAAEELILLTVFESADRKSAIQRQIEADGLMVGGKPHPLLKALLDADMTIQRGVRLLKLSESEPAVTALRKVV